MTKKTYVKQFNNNYGRIPPQAIDIEKAILGAILIEGSSFIRISHYFKNEGIFYKDVHNKIIKAIKDIHEINGAIDVLTVGDKLKINGDFDEIGGTPYIVELTANIASAAHLDFHCALFTDKYLLREIIRIGTEMADKAYEEQDPKMIAEWTENELLEKFDLDIEGKATFKDALSSTLLDISNKSKGIISSFIKTGDPEIDSKISFREKQICLIAGSEGSGKTKYMTYIAKKILDNNKNIRILWVSMEDTKEQIIRSFISINAKLTTKQLQSINYELSEDQLKIIHKIANDFNDYKIDFIDRVSSIRTIMRRGKMIHDKYKEDSLIIIIDNLGLITTDSFYKGIEKDDYLAAKLKELCDDTNASLFLLHHITKENSKRFNINEGYRPRKEYIKGSTRILDYVQQALLVNLPRKHKDLVMQEKEKAKVFDIKPRTGRFDETRFLMEFWTINPKGDKNTKTITDLKKVTWDELRYVCITDKQNDGSNITVSFIIKKYLEYSAFIDDKNRDRETQFHTEKLSIYTFINTKKYNEDFSPQNNSRSYYLYGNNMELSKNINSLFIVESVKNRDGSDIEDQSIIRYDANLDYNIFKPLKNQN